MSGGWRVVESAFAGLWRALEDVTDPAERRIARDAVRDALDRNAARVDQTLPDEAGGRFVADTFALEAPIADGGFATVYRVRHRDLGSVHAVKILKPAHARDPVCRRLFLTEARHHLLLSHPAVVKAECLLRTSDGRLALLMQFVDSRSLAEVASGGRVFDEEEAIRLARRVADALDAVHAAGLVHLDLSPANILLPAGGGVDDARLCDFGLSLPEGKRHADAEIAVAATPFFAAPEQQLGTAPLDRRADVFALGTLLEWLPRPASDRLAALVAAATPSDSRERLPDMAAVKAALQPTRRETHAGRPPEDVDQRPQHARKPLSADDGSPFPHAGASQI